MGDMADYFLDQQMLIQENHEKKLRFQEQGIWVTRDKNHIKVIDMTDSHLLSSLRMCKRNNVNSWVVIFRKEIKRRKQQ